MDGKNRSGQLPKLGAHSDLDRRSRGGDVSELGEDSDPRFQGGRMGAFGTEKGETGVEVGQVVGSISNAESTDELRTSGDVMLMRKWHRRSSSFRSRRKSDASISDAGQSEKDSSRREEWLRSWVAERNLSELSAAFSQGTDLTCASTFSMASVWSHTSEGAVYRPQDLGVGRLRAEFPREPLVRTEDIEFLSFFRNEELRRKQFEEEMRAEESVLYVENIDELAEAQLRPPKPTIIDMFNVRFELVIFAEEKIFYQRNVMKDADLVRVGEWLTATFSDEELRNIAEGLRKEYETIADEYSNLKEKRRTGRDASTCDQLENKMRFTYIAVEQRMRAVAEAIVNVLLREADEEMIARSSRVTTAENSPDNPTLDYDIDGLSDSASEGDNLTECELEELQLKRRVSGRRRRNSRTEKSILAAFAILGQRNRRHRRSLTQPEQTIEDTTQQSPRPNTWDEYETKLLQNAQQE